MGPRYVLVGRLGWLGWALLGLLQTPSLIVCGVCGYKGGYRNGMFDIWYLLTVKIFCYIRSSPLIICSMMCDFVPTLCKIDQYRIDHYSIIIGIIMIDHT